LLIKNGIIEAVGGAGDPVPAAPRGAAVIDAQGLLVLPGLTDSHVHFVGHALSLRRLNLDGTNSLDEVLALVARNAAQVPDGEWLRGRGWSVNAWPGGRFPSRRDLDRIAPKHPVALTSKDGHTLWMNSLALALIGLDSAVSDPPGGAFGREPDSHELDGIVQEKAVDVVLPLLPRLDWRQAADLAAAAQPLAHALGITGIHNFEGAVALRAFQSLRERDALTLNVVAYLGSEELSAVATAGLTTGFGDGRLCFGGIKLFADGALGSRSAALLLPYLNEPDNTGISIPIDELGQAVRAAAAAGCGIAIHAIGDRANRTVLDLFQQTREQELPATTPLPLRLEHAQLLAVEDLPRPKQLRVTLSMQPAHATSDMDMAELYWGRDRIERGGYAFAQFIAAGAEVIFGSDAPIEPLDPWAGIHAAVTLRRTDGRPGPQGWLPAGRISVEQAVQAYTTAPGRVHPLRRGAAGLAVGGQADVVVLSQDIFSIPPNEIPNTRALLTISDGRIVHQAESLR